MLCQIPLPFLPHPSVPTNGGRIGGVIPSRGRDSICTPSWRSPDVSLQQNLTTSSPTSPFAESSCPLAIPIPQTIPPRVAPSSLCQTTGWGHYSLKVFTVLILSGTGKSNNTTCACNTQQLTSIFAAFAEAPVTTFHHPPPIRGQRAASDATGGSSSNSLAVARAGPATAVPEELIDMGTYLQYASDHVQYFAMRTEDGEVCLIDDPVFTGRQCLKFELHLLQAVENAVRAMLAELVRRAVWWL